MTAHDRNMPRLSAGDLLFCPGGDEERDMRERLGKGRDIALMRATSSRPPEVRDLYWQAVYLANAWLTRPASVQHLRRVRYAVARIFLAAGALERLEDADDARQC